MKGNWAFTFLKFASPHAEVAANHYVKKRREEKRRAEQSREEKRREEKRREEKRREAIEDTESKSGPLARCCIQRR